MDAADRRVLPEASLEKPPSIVIDNSDASDASPVREDSGTNSPGSNSSFSDPLTGNEDLKTIPASLKPLLRLDIQLADLFAENVVAKIWKVAARELKKENPPTSYPEYVPSTGPDANKYTMTEADFWTCGFFPGSLYALLERAMKYPQFLPIPIIYRPTFHTYLLDLCRAWSVPIRAMKTRTDTHDMSFIIQPALRTDWELTGNTDSLQCVITAAHSLASRFNKTVGAIRSWDDTSNHRYTFTNLETDFMVIIDSMCNLDLLYYAGHQTGDQKLIDIATTHAHTVLRAIVRDDWSTYHLINFDPKTGAIKNQLTNQGHRDWSTWSRGQAWAILGFTQTYTWTHDPTFLHAAISVSKYFLSRLSSGTYPYPYVPPWDFDAPIPTSGPIRDASAGMIAANGMLLLHQALTAENRHDEAACFLEALLRIVRETLSLCLAPEKSAFAAAAGTPSSLTSSDYPTVDEPVPGPGFDAILKHATANNNEFSFKRYADHGLVYADYYFLELGNKMLRMGLL